MINLMYDCMNREGIQCPHCLASHRIKGRQKIQYRALFGIIPVSGLRVYHGLLSRLSRAQMGH